MQTYREFYEQSRRRRRKRFLRRTLAVALVLLLIFGLAWVIVTLTGGDGEKDASSGTAVSTGADSQATSAQQTIFYFFLHLYTLHKKEWLEFQHCILTFLLI